MDRGVKRKTQPHVQCEKQNFNLLEEPIYTTQMQEVRNKNTTYMQDLRNKNPFWKL
jgi:hypothetical protein